MRFFKKKNIFTFLKLGCISYSIYTYIMVLLFLLEKLLNGLRSLQARVI